MSVATIAAAVVSQRSFGRPFASPETLCRAVIVADVDGATFRRRVEASGDDAYRLRTALLRVTGQRQWARVLHSPVRAVVVDGEVVAIRSPEGAAEDAQLTLDSLVLSFHQVTS